MNPPMPDAAAPDVRLRRNLLAHESAWGVVPTWTEADLQEVRIDCLPPRDDAAERWSVAVECDGQWRLLVSERAPAREAQALVDRLLPGGTNPAIVIVVGAGLGYVLEAVLRRAPAARLLVLEPVAGLAHALLSRRDWSALIEVRQLQVLAGPAYHGCDEAWRMFPASSEPPPVIVLPALSRLRPEATLGATRVASSVARNAAMNQQARLKFGGIYVENSLANLPRLLDAGDVGDLANTSTGRVVVVAAAGPSLDRNIDELRPHRDSVTLVAVDTALRPLVLAGLEPDFVVAVDPGQANARTLTEAGPHASVRLVAELSVSPDVFPHFTGRTWLFRVGDNEPWPWLLAAGLDLGRLHAWGSVLITATDFAVRLGGGPVVLLGADLGYTGGQPYCRDTVYELDWARQVLAGASARTMWQAWVAGASREETGDTGPAPTTDTMVAFREALAAMARRLPAGTLLNATRGGILRQQDVPACTLDEVVRGAPRALTSVEPKPPAVTADALVRLVEERLMEVLAVPPPAQPDRHVVSGLGRGLAALAARRSASLPPLAPGSALTLVLDGNGANEFSAAGAHRLVEAVEQLRAAGAERLPISAVGPMIDGIMRYARSVGRAGAPGARAADGLLSACARHPGARLAIRPRPVEDRTVRVACLGLARNFSPRDVLSWSLHSLAAGLGRAATEGVSVHYYDLAAADEAYLAELTRAGVTVRTPWRGFGPEAYLPAVRASLARDGIDATVSLGVTWLSAATCAVGTCPLQIGFDYGMPRYESGWHEQVPMMPSASVRGPVGIPLDPRPLADWCGAHPWPLDGSRHRFGHLGSLSDWPSSFTEFAIRLVLAHEGASLLACGLGDASALQRAFDDAGIGHRLQVDMQNDIESALARIDVALVPRAPVSLFHLLLKHLDVPVLVEGGWSGEPVSVPVSRSGCRRSAVSQPLPEHDAVRVATEFGEWLATRVGRLLH